MMLFWCNIWIVSLLCMAAGANLIDDPMGNLWIGVAVMYGACFTMIVATVKLAGRSTWK